MKKNANINFKGAAKEAARIIKSGYEHYPSVHRLEAAILEAYCVQSGADLKNLKRSARAIRLNADIDWRSIFYCSLISSLIGEDVSPKLFDKVCNDLVLINSKGDFVKVSDMEKIHVRGDEYVVLSKDKGQPCLLMRMGDPYWYGCIYLYEYGPERDVALKTMHVPTSMVEGF